MRNNILLSILTTLALLCCLTLHAQNKFPNKKAEVQQMLDSLLDANSYKYMYIDIDNDGCSELFARDKEGNKCVIAWNGKAFTTAYLGFWKFSTAYNDGIIVSSGGVGTGVAMEYLVSIKNSTIVSAINIFKEYNPVTDEMSEEINGGTAKQVAEAYKHINNDNAKRINFDEGDWTSFNDFKGETDTESAGEFVYNNTIMVDAFVYDHDGTFTNIRKTPKGAIHYQLTGGDARNGIMLTLITSNTEGWFEIASYWDPNEKDYNMIIGAYIHYSCIAVSTRNYGGETYGLKTNIADKKFNYTFNKETLLRPIRISKDGNWIYVATIGGKHKGWIERDKLCGNSVTNCN